tara:strand:- start:149 stop:1474 length:1326 start_codon:yes stop_codon:yes gene_type:complete
MSSPLESRWEKHDIQSQLASANRLVVAYSGGADSLSLLLLAASTNKQVVGLHINHGLHPDADEWQKICAEQCRVLGIPFEFMSVVVEKGGSVEQHARNARYQAFEDFLMQDDLLLLAHHADDQLETVLFNLLRGSSVAGVVGMPSARAVGAARLFRPLLDVQRSSLVEFCTDKGLRWVEDSSNFDVSLDRGYLRHKVIPLIEARWPDAGATLLRAVDRDGEVRQLIDSVAEKDLAHCRSAVGLSVDKLLALSSFRREHLLRAWISNAGFPLPTLGVLRTVSSDVLLADESAEPCVSWQGCEIRRFKDSMVFRSQEDFLLPNEPIVLNYESPLSLDVGILSSAQELGRGVPISGDLSVRFRRGGERMRVNGQTRPLKKIMQESGIPPWLRAQLPLVYCGDSLILIPGIRAWRVEPVVSSDHLAEPDGKGLIFWFEECQSLPH